MRKTFGPILWWHSLGLIIQLRRNCTSWRLCQRWKRFPLETVEKLLETLKLTSSVYTCNLSVSAWQRSVEKRRPYPMAKETVNLTIIWQCVKIKAWDLNLNSNSTNTNFLNNKTEDQKIKFWINNSEILLTPSPFLGLFLGWYDFRWFPLFGYDTRL